MRDSVSQLDMCRQNPTYLMPNDFRRAYSPADGLAAKDPGKNKVQLVQCRVSYTEEDRKREVIGGSVKRLFSSQPSYRSCVYCEVPLRCTRSFVFLDKSLCISLVELEGEGPRKPALYRSTLSVCLSASSCHRSSNDIKPVKKNEGYVKSKATMLGTNQRTGRESASGHCRDPVSKHKGHKFDRTPPAHGVNTRSDDSDTNCFSTTLGLLSFRGPGPSNTKAGTQKGNADEAGFSAWRNFRHRQHSFNTGSVNSRTRINQAASEETCKGQKDDCSTEPERVSTLDKTCYYHSQLKASSLEGTPKTLSLKEALELFRPDFISRSQGRLKRLEQRARIRKALQDSNPDLMQGPRGTQVKQKRNCTTPDPLSDDSSIPGAVSHVMKDPGGCGSRSEAPALVTAADNLFKPRERSISSREMQLRSRRIYNMLPEVTKRKEEEKKRAVSQTNRLRAEVFKKRILDQVLQR